MKANRIPAAWTSLLLTVVVLGTAATVALPSAAAQETLTGAAAFTDYSKEAPGIRRKITPADLPAPYATPSANNGAVAIPRPDNAWPKAPEGFKVEQFATGLEGPRLMRMAPNGDIFVAESAAGKILVFRGMGADGKAAKMETFATDLKSPFGINFYPAGPNPKYLYIGNTESVVRFPYKSGDLKATGPAETLATLPGGGGHRTRDIVFTSDGKHMLVSVGSASNDNDSDTDPKEFHRADVLEFTPDGKFEKIYASGIRNCVGETIHPRTGDLWCSTNERDGLGNNLVPDYVTHVQEGGFYGWPWYYTGGNQDPRQMGKHPELKAKVIVPDVLLQPHFASLQLQFYEAKQFPAEFHGWAFAAEHGSWNRDPRGGYEVVALPMKDDKATGEFQDFLTGFVTPEGKVWGRPVGIAVARDGSLLVSDDASNTIWRVSYTGTKTAASGQ
jgi:glucose/arabinose dehydrogenase